MSDSSSKKTWRDVLQLVRINMAERLIWFAVRFLVPKGTINEYVWLKHVRDANAELAALGDRQFESLEKRDRCVR